MESTGKILLIVESPNKIKKISSYLGDKYIIRASFGHIRDLKKGGKVHKLGVKIENNYEPVYCVLEDKQDKVNSIISVARSVEKIYLATDPDREGEAIAFHLHSCLEFLGKPIQRVTFNEITKSAILKAVENPRDLDMCLFNAQQARRVLDRIVGFLASDFLRFSKNTPLSAGRVQSVATRMVVDREREIKAFKSENYWNIFANVSVNGVEFESKLIEKVTDSETASKIKNELKNSTLFIKSIEKKEKARKPSAPFTTSKLQQVASNKLGFAVKKTMTVAQSLYESGLITYMRSDSTRIAPEALEQLLDYLKTNNIPVPETPNDYKTKDAAQDAHEAIRPSDVNKIPKFLFINEDELALYNLIWERFVASQMQDAVYDTVSVVIGCKENHYELKANGRSLRVEGWLALIKDDGNDEKVTLLPEMVESDILTNKEVKTEKKSTPPPSRYGEAALVNELEKKGIGRPSTYASIIETIKGRGYIELKGKAYQPTKLGKEVIDSLVKYFKFMDYKYTADMERDLDSIAEGKATYFDVIDNFFMPFKEECREAQYGESPDYGIYCSKCNGKMILRHGSYGFYLSCMKYPVCKDTLSVDMVDGKPVVVDKEARNVEGVSCPKCNGGMRINEAGRFGPYYFCENSPKCKGTRKVPYGKQCPNCKDELYMTVLEGNKKLLCMGYFKEQNCRYSEDLPEGEDAGWLDPSEHRKEQLELKKPKTVRKIINARRGK
jgi:DNA topoisomerase-1